MKKLGFSKSVANDNIFIQTLVYEYHGKNYFEKIAFDVLQFIRSQIWQYLKLSNLPDPFLTEIVSNDTLIFDDIEVYPLLSEDVISMIEAWFFYIFFVHANFSSKIVLKKEISNFMKEENTETIETLDFFGMKTLFYYFFSLLIFLGKNIKNILLT